VARGSKLIAEESLTKSGGGTSAAKVVVILR
jgi:hypothetical protein